jgi:hypothetical protein
MCQRSEQLRQLMMRNAAIFADRRGALDDLVSWTAPPKWSYADLPNGWDRDRWGRQGTISPYHPDGETLYAIGRRS